MTSIHPRLNPLAVFGIPFLGGESLQLGFHPQQYDLRQAVRQMKRYMLHCLRTFKMWQISTAMPHPGNANLPIGGLSDLPGTTFQGLDPSLPANREIGVPRGHFLTPAVQLTTTVMGADSACSGSVLIRNRWPSAATAYG